MNKKFLSVILFSALMVGTAGTFTSCKDYDDDIKDLQGQLDKKASLDDLNAKVATLQTAVDEAKTAANEAKAKAQEARAKVIEAEAQIPLAMAEAFRKGNLGIMDYYKFKNIQADTDMRESMGMRKQLMLSADDRNIEENLKLNDFEDIDMKDGRK